MTAGPKTKPCNICAHPIPERARKCTDCGEFQSTPARIMAGFDLKGVLALLPLLALIYAFLAERFERQTSDLNVTTVACSGARASVFASNPGNRTALLETGSFQATGDPIGRFNLPDDLSLRVFEPGAARMITLTVDERRNPGGLASFDSRNLETCEVALTFSVVRHDQSRMMEVGSCACPSS